MKRNFYLGIGVPGTKRAIVLLAMLTILAGNIFAQQNISQDNHLSFFPKTSGQLTLWETTKSPMSSYSGSPEYTIIAYDGQRRFTLQSGSYNVVNQVSGVAALIGGKKKFYNGKALFDLPAGSTDAIISDKHVFWTGSGITGLNYFYENPANSVPIYSAEPGPKTLLAAAGERVVYAQNNHIYLAKVNNGVTQLTTDPYPTYFASDSLNLVWIQSDGHDGEVFYYDGTTIHQLTNDEVEQTNPVISGNRIAWQVSQGSATDLYFYDGGAYASQITNGAFLSISNVAIVNNKVVFESGGAIYYFNGAFAEKIAQDIQTGSFISSKLYATWALAPSVNNYALYSFNGSVVKKEFTFPSTYNGYGHVSLAGSFYVYDTSYDPSEIFAYDLAIGKYSNYKVGDVSLSSCQGTEKFSVPIIAKDSIRPGLIGLDFVLHYDTNLFVPTGLVSLGNFDDTYGAYGINKNVPGKLFVNLYLNAAPSAHFIKAIGTLVNVQFQLKTGAASPVNSYITSEMVRENLPIESWDIYPADSGSVSTGTGTHAQIVYRGFADRPLSYDLEHPEKYIPTTIFPSKESSYCGTDSTRSTVTDENGNFYIAATQFSYNVVIRRDIPGDFYASPLSCTDVMGVINAADRNKALEIANFTITNPSVYDLIAADVNLDRKVTSADVALISSRTVNSNYCEFPQIQNYAWNGTSYVPTPTYRKSLDWMFFNEYTFSPIENNTTYNRNNTPFLGNECARNVSIYCNSKYNAILLGDVAASWTPANSAQLRTAASENSVSINFSNLIPDGENTYLAAIRINSADNVKALDFSFEHNKALTVKGLKKDAAYNQLGFVWNDVASQKAMFTAFDEKGFIAQGAVAYVALHSDNPGGIRDAISNVKAYINGEPAAVELDAITGVDEAAGTSTNFSLVPNPSSGNVTLQSGFLQGDVKIEILNSLGQVLRAYTEKVSGNYLNKNIDISSLSAGTYLVKFITQDGLNVEKLVVQ